jgi:hypothetical protein
MESALFLNVVVGEGTAVFELLSSENQALLVWWDALLVLDFRFDVVDRVGGFDFEGDGLAGENLDENLHTAAKTEDQVEGALLLNVVVGEGAAIFKLLAGEDETLLVWGNAFLVLNLRLYVVDSVRRLHLQGDGLASEGLDENLHGEDWFGWSLKALVVCLDVNGKMWEDLMVKFAGDVVAAEKRRKGE